MVKKLLVKKEVLLFFEYVDNSVLVNDIGWYFIWKINIIWLSIDVVLDFSVGVLLLDDLVVGFSK